MIVILPYAVHYAIRGSIPEDGGVFWLTLWNLLAVSMIGLLVAFVLAIVAIVQHERWLLLWLPLCAFPVFLVFVGSVV